MSWLDMPLPLFRALARRLAPLQAEESLRLAAAVAVGAGMLEDPTRVTGEWERIAQGADRRPRPTVSERRAFAEMLGISVAHTTPAVG